MVIVRLVVAFVAASLAIQVVAQLGMDSAILVGLTWPLVFIGTLFAWKPVMNWLIRPAAKP